MRFSNGSADPDAHDGARDGRGMATKFRLDDGSSTDIVALSLPVFFVRTTDDFVEFVKAREPDPATGEMDLDRVLAFLGAHPEAQLAAELSVAALAPASYSQVTYHSVHVFWMVDADGGRHPVRYRWEPAAPGDGLPDDEALARPRDYLTDALAADLEAGPVRFDLHVVEGQPGDPVGDPTAPWPDDRPSRVAGTLELTALADAEPLIFDPTRVTDGIECSDDPILAPAVPPTGPRTPAGRPDPTGGGSGRPGSCRSPRPGLACAPGSRVPCAAPRRRPRRSPGPVRRPPRSGCSARR